MFDRLENEIALYKQHLIDTRAKGSPIEQVFVGYVLTRIHAEFESSIKSAINDRCYIESDTPLNKYVEWATDRIIRSLRLSELRGVLNRFDNNYNDQFQATVDTDQQTQVSWNKIIENRQAFAHKAPANVTLTEVQEDFSKAKDVIVAFREALGLSD